MFKLTSGVIRDSEVPLWGRSQARGREEDPTRVKAPIHGSAWVGEG